ncbi:YfjI family protein [Klebsiella quasipneumoniae]|uniref:YfjI family protein n=1 Tax=Klebsiella quasipneumoniae TaxID=1463165 RepID=UPI00272F565D|nr:YfjI family protein [Klebsiella quasipneumoniae]MDP1298390.1 YfjI family protein [Klebsiella quasipneumoniae]
MKNEIIELKLDFTKFPVFLQTLIKWIQMRTGAAVEMILSTALGVMALACQDRFDVKPEGRPGHPISLFILVLAGSGKGKSTVFRLLMRAVTRLETRLEEEYRLLLIQYKKDMTSWKIEHKNAEKRYRQVCDLSPENPLRLETLEILNACTGREPEKPIRKRFTISDTTSEALRKELGLEYPNLVIASDEAGGQFESNLYRQTPWINSLWSGDRIAAIRASSKCYAIEDARLGILGMIQPQLFGNFMMRQGKTARLSGFLPRCQMMDLDLNPYPCDISGYPEPHSAVLDDFEAIVTEHLLAGISRREKKEQRPCITFTPDAQLEWDKCDSAIKKLMEPGNILEIYNDTAARFMEQVTRTAAVLQMFITPNSAIITRDTLLSAIHIANWYLDHFIAKVDQFRTPTDAEKIERFMEKQLIKNESFTFVRREIRINGPVRDSERLESALEVLSSQGKVQLLKKHNTNYVRFIGSKTSPQELCSRLHIPTELWGAMVLSKLPEPK